MSANAPPSPANRDQKLFKAGVLALLVHVGFFIFMTFGLSWKTFPPEGIVVDLWSDLPQPEQPPVKKVKPLPPKPVQPPKKVKPLPPKKVKPLPPKKAEPLSPKPDIALKKEKEKKQKLAEEKKAKEKKAREKKAKEKKAKEQKAKEQKARVAAEVKKQLAEEERIRLQKKAAGAQAAKKRNLIDEYKARILAKIKSRLVLPPDLPNDPVTEFDVTLLPGGEILKVTLRKSSGFPSFDKAVESAIVLSRPLPLPPDPALFSNFRDLSLKVHYNE
jgi:colicin import membrane protein